MARLEELTRGASVKGILPDSLVTVVDVKWHGSTVVELTYKDPSGRLGNELLYRDREPTLEIASVGGPWGFDGDGAMFRLVSEAHPSAISGKYFVRTSPGPRASAQAKSRTFSLS